PRSAVEPQPRLVAVRHAAQSPPRDGERLCDDVQRVRMSYAPKRVPEDAFVVRFVELAKPGGALVLAQGSGHRFLMSGADPNVSSGDRGSRERAANETRQDADERLIRIRHLDPVEPHPQLAGLLLRLVVEIPADLEVVGD